MNPNLCKILYVEDEVDIQQIAQIALEKIGGFEVKICSSGRQALAEVSAFNPDLILLDVMMPELDGPETFEQLKTLPGVQSTPVIFMTAKVQPQEVQEYLNRGALGVIPKPFDPLELSQRICEIWNKRHAS